MRSNTLISLVVSLAAGLSLHAQGPTGPPQPATGPGGSTYPYSGFASFGPFYALPNNTQAYNTYYIYAPTKPFPASLPVVLFIHGHLLNLEGPQQGDSPSNYLAWFRQMALMGYTVVYPIYDASLPESDYNQSIFNAYSAALTLLQSGTVKGLAPPASDSQGLQTACTGHSLGAILCLALAQELSIKPVQNVPIPRAIASITLGLGNNQTLTTDYSQISSSVSIVLVGGNHDLQDNDLGASFAVWASLVNNIPPSQKDFVEVITDNHGTPAQLGNHFFALTNGFDDDTSVDDRDYNAVWKISVGLFNCVFRGTDCEYGLGHGSPQQLDMGLWSDGVPVAPLALENNEPPPLSH